MFPLTGTETAGTMASTQKMCLTGAASLLEVKFSSLCRHNPLYGLQHLQIGDIHASMLLLNLFRPCIWSEIET